MPYAACSTIEDESSSYENSDCNTGSLVDHQTELSYVASKNSSNQRDQNVTY